MAFLRASSLFLVAMAVDGLAVAHASASPSYEAVQVATPTMEETLLLPAESHVVVEGLGDVPLSALREGQRLALKRGEHAVVLRRSPAAAAPTPASATRGAERVSGISRTRTQSIIHIDTGDEQISATEMHRFAVRDRGWVPAAQLREGDELFAASGRITVRGVANEPVAPRDVYNLIVERAHVFRVGQAAVLVHNGDCTSEAQIPPQKGERPIHRDYSQVQFDALPYAPKREIVGDPADNAKSIFGQSTHRVAIGKMVEGPVYRGDDGADYMVRRYPDRAEAIDRVTFEHEAPRWGVPQVKSMVVKDGDNWAYAQQVSRSGDHWHAVTEPSKSVPISPDQLSDVPKPYKTYLVLAREGAPLPVYGAAGHIGVGMQLRKNLFLAVSSENHAGTPITAGPLKDNWVAFFHSEKDMKDAWRNRASWAGYNEITEATVHQSEREAYPALARAVQKANELRSSTYCVLGANCLTETYAVLRARGLIGTRFIHGPAYYSILPHSFYDAAPAWGRYFANFGMAPKVEWGPSKQLFERTQTPPLNP